MHDRKCRFCDEPIRAERVYCGKNCYRVYENRKRGKPAFFGNFLRGNLFYCPDEACARNFSRSMYLREHLLSEHSLRFDHVNQCLSHTTRPLCSRGGCRRIANRRMPDGGGWLCVRHAARRGRDRALSLDIDLADGSDGSDGSEDLGSLDPPSVCWYRPADIDRLMAWRRDRGLSSLTVGN